MRLLAELKDYTESHFSDEEELMKKSDILKSKHRKGHIQHL